VKQRLDVMLLPRRGFRILPHEVVDPRQQSADLVAGLRIEQRLHGRLDGQVFDAASLDARALHRIAKGPPELARTRAEVEQPVGLAVGRLLGQRALLAEFVVHAKHGGADRFGFVDEALQPQDRFVGLHQTGSEDRRIDSIRTRGQRRGRRRQQHGDCEAQEKPGRDRRGREARACEHRLPRVPNLPPPFKPKPRPARFFAHPGDSRTRELYLSRFSRHRAIEPAIVTREPRANPKPYALDL